MTMEELHRNAITLNNLGVVLLEQGASTQALETFRDAVDTLKVACAVMDQSRRQDFLSLSMEKIRVASQKVDNPIRRGSKLIRESHCWERVDLRSSSALSMASFTFGLECFVSFSLCSQVAIQDRDRELDSCLMLYNYALAYLANAFGRNQLQALRSALCLLKMSFTIFMTHVENDMKGSWYWEGDNLTKVLTLAVAVLSNLSRALFIVGYEIEARDCYQRLTEMYDCLTTVEEIHLCSKRSGAAAAA